MRLFLENNVQPILLPAKTSIWLQVTLFCCPCPFGFTPFPFQPNDIGVNKAFHKAVKKQVAKRGSHSFTTESYAGLILDSLHQLDKEQAEMLPGGRNDVTMAWDSSGLGKEGTIATAPAFQSACRTIGPAAGAAEEEGEECSAVDADVKRCLGERASMDIRSIEYCKVNSTLQLKRCNHERDLQEIKEKISQAYEEIGTCFLLLSVSKNFNIDGLCRYWK